MVTEMVTSNGEYCIEWTTGEDALGNNDTEPILEVWRWIIADAENGWQHWKPVGLFSADQIIDVLRRVEALPF